MMLCGMGKYGRVMTQYIGIVYDVIFLLLVLGAAEAGRRRGFASGLVSFIGSVAGIIGGTYGTRVWAGGIYDKYVASHVTDVVADTLEKTGGDLAQAIHALTFLPQSIQQKLIDTVSAASSNAVPQVVNALEPLFLPVIQAVVFLSVWIVVRALCRMLGRVLRGINAIPLIGGLNRILGFAFGFVSGLLNCWIWSILLWVAANLTGGKLEFLTTASRICEKGLRYDLTVPFARYVVQHQSEIAFPFKRYQIQPVWRADRPQKGRYREFYQCDVDVIGTRSLLCEVELIQIVERVFRTLGINVSLKVNNRKILYGIAETIGHADKMIDITVAIDKLEKIGLEAVKAELTERGIGSDAIEKLQPILELTGDNERKLAVLRDVIGASAVGLEGISEMETIFGYVNRLGVELPIELDFSLARGLNYYTGAIFEVKALDFAIGSICGGGRYDDLTGIFGMPNMSGVGISFGADRIYDVMTGLGLFPADLGCAARVMFANLGEAEEHASLKLLQEVRAAGIPAEIYPENGKMKKQMEYANRRGIPCVVIVGSRELEERVATIKDMTSGEQTQVPFTRLAEALR